VAEMSIPAITDDGLLVAGQEGSYAVSGSLSHASYHSAKSSASGNILDLPDGVALALADVHVM